MSLLPSRALVQIARTQVLGEGVETSAQLETLRKGKCDVLQGHLFSRSVSAEQAARFLQLGRLRPASAKTFRRKPPGSVLQHSNPFCKDVTGASIHHQTTTQAIGGTPTSLSPTLLSSARRKLTHNHAYASATARLNQAAIVYARVLTPVQGGKCPRQPIGGG